LEKEIFAVIIGGFAGADGVLYSKTNKRYYTKPTSFGICLCYELVRINKWSEDPAFQLVNGAGAVPFLADFNKIPKTFKKTTRFWIILNT
jgi:hypothetical protein